jgi:S-methylmethionine-dependent homocysteine/selenocysteine methylase
MSTNPTPIPDGDVVLTDGGIETTLVFDDGFELTDFAAFPLLDDADGRAALIRYFERYAEIAVRDGVPLILETPTWRASADWAARQGIDTGELVRLNLDSVRLVREVAARFATDRSPIVVSGCIGPRGDGYQVGDLMSVAEARNYHGLQARAFAEAGADLITAITMTYRAEAHGVVEAARAAGLPVVISFTVETDGTLPSGEPLGASIEAIDAATDGYATHYMVNCAHPEHLAPALDPSAAWSRRLGGLRANASRLSHAELDDAEELDRGDATELGGLYRLLRTSFPQVRVLGGCCGTDHTHVAAISAACVAA